MRSKVAGLLAALWLAGISGAAAADWAQEPETVMGLAVGQPFSPPPLTACGLGPADPCLTEVTFMPGRYVFRNPPALGFSYEASLDLYMGKLMQIGFILDTSSFDRATAVLSERYGQPTSVSESDFVTQTGAKFKTRKYQWIGKRLSIVAVERNVRADRGHIAFFDQALAAEKQRVQKDQDKAAASKL